MGANARSRARSRALPTPQTPHPAATRRLWPEPPPRVSAVTRGGPAAAQQAAAAAQDGGGAARTLRSTAIVVKRGVPRRVVAENGRELLGLVFDLWAYYQGGAGRLQPAGQADSQRLRRVVKRLAAGRVLKCEPVRVDRRGEGDHPGSVRARDACNAVRAIRDACAW